jgi:Alcohol dehydrogenase transcription factor Myb/SANT-like
MEGTDENTRIIQLTSASLIDAYQNEPSLWDYRLNSSEDEKERKGSTSQVVRRLGNACINICFSSYFNV